MNKKEKYKKIIGISVTILLILVSIVAIIINTTSKENDEVDTTAPIQKRAMNSNNYTMVKSKDGIDVPVPKGYTASSVESESYVYEGTEEVTDRNQ